MSDRPCSSDPKAESAAPPLYASPAEQMAMVNLALLRRDRILADAAQAEADCDLARLTTLRQEMELVVEGLRDLREQQIMDSIRKPKRRRWRLFRHA